MDIVPPAIDDYLHKVQPVHDATLRAMQREGERRGFPIIGPLVGRLCEQLARSIQARSVFELGSGFGYSTAWFARAVGKGGRVVHTEFDAAKSKEAKVWLTKARLASRVEFRVGDALDLLRSDRNKHDLVFIDVDKEQYPAAFQLAAERVRVGGLIVTDNALWHGRVTGKARDAATAGVRTYTRLAFDDKRLLTTILPVRDGVAVSLRVR